MALGVLFLSSGAVTDGTSLPWLFWDVGVRAEFDGWDTGDDVLPADDFLPFFSTPLFGTKTSNVGGSLRGVPSSPGEKDRNEQ